MSVVSNKNRWIVLVVVALCLVPEIALAQDEPEEARETALEKGPMVRRKLLYRSTRVELAPLFGFTLADPFTRNGIAGLSANFHLTNEFAIGITGGLGVIQSPTDLRNNMDEALNAGSNRGADRIGYSHVGWLASLEGSWVPMFGKFSILDSMTVNYDMHLIFGAAFIGQAAQSAAPGLEVTDTSLIGNKVAPTVGIGFRFFVSDFMSVNLQLRDFIYSRAEFGDGTTSTTRLSNNFMLSLGLSFFLPTEVKVSR